MSPEITGDTENGRSMSVIRKLFPLKSNLAMAQAAATPNTRFRGTLIPAAMRVSLIAARASGSLIAAKYAPTPFSRAWEKTEAKGTTRNSPRKAKTIPVNTQRTGAGSVSPLCEEPLFSEFFVSPSGRRIDFLQMS